MKETRLLRVGQAAKILGIHVQTLRVWTRQGKIACQTMGTQGQRRYREDVVLAFARELYGTEAEDAPGRSAILYLRVSGPQGQETSLASQETELRAQAQLESVQVIAVIKDHGSGLNERRTGLLRSLALLKEQQAQELWVTHGDRLARFGLDWLRALIDAYGAKLVILHHKETMAPQEELMADFMALIASFSGRLYGQRSAALRRKLLADAQIRIDNE
jgi:excisionase family DNA binding protein